MSTKSDYAPDEWKLLLDLPPLVGSAVMVSGRSGLGTVKEAFALAHGVLDGKHEFQANDLIGALIDARTKEGDRSGLEQFANNPYRSLSPDELRQTMLDKCSAVADLLATKSTPQEAREFKQWTLEVGEKVAAAAKEGGFLGIGGQRISEPERDVLSAISQALGI